MAFRQQLSWTSSPLIVNAPMGGFAGPTLAAAVSRAGGLGLIGALDNPDTISQQLEKTAELLSASPAVHATNGTLPVGVGLLLFILKTKRAAVLEVLARHKPAVIWLFAEPALADFGTWAAEIRGACPKSQIWIQTCSSSSAVELARTARPDVLVMQGADAGGHGWERGAGVISLVPETRDALAREGLEVGVVAAGGIVDGRGVAAALSLGADGVVMGTRFLASNEVVVHPLFQKQVLETTDGGQQTVRAKLFDELKGPNIWPAAYDGRAIISNSYEDYTAGVGIEQIREKHAEAVADKEDLGWGSNARAAVWAGTGVGLVKEVQEAADIVREVRDGAKARLEEAKARL